MCMFMEGCVCLHVNIHAHVCGDQKSTLGVVPRVFETRSCISLGPLISLDWLAPEMLLLLPASPVMGL